MRRVGLKEIKEHTASVHEEPLHVICDKDKTRAQLMAELDSLGISYQKRASKDELIGLLKMAIVLDNQNQDDEILPDPEEE